MSGHCDQSRVPAKYRHLRVSQLERLPTLCVGQASDLKIDDDTYRVWLCRCGIADGMSDDNMVEIEVNDNGRWKETCTYPGLI